LKAEEQKRLEAQMTEAERLKKQTDELLAEKVKLESELMKRDVIAETGLPAALADRLKGSTKEELVNDAQELLKLLPKTKSPQSVTNPSGASMEETEQQRRERLLGKSANIFDMKTIKAGGGGVIFKE
jgi:5'-3' exonuclease